MKKKNTRQTDTKFFVERLTGKGLSIRRAAAMLNFDHAGLSRVLRGSKPAHIDLACDLARLLGVGLDDVIRKLGYDVPRESMSKVVLHGQVLKDGTVEPRSRGKSLGTVDRPRGMPDDVAAVQIAVPGEPFDGWVAYFIPGSGGIAPEAVGRLSHVKDSEGREFIGILEKDRDRGKWHVKMLKAEFGNGGIVAKAAAPIEWIRL